VFQQRGRIANVLEVRQCIARPKLPRVLAISSSRSVANAKQVPIPDLVRAWPSPVGNELLAGVDDLLVTVGVRKDRGQRSFNPCVFLLAQPGDVNATRRIEREHSESLAHHGDRLPPCEFTTTSTVRTLWPASSGTRWRVGSLSIRSNAVFAMR
jgi:hypothetical protein